MGLGHSKISFYCVDFTHKKFQTLISPHVIIHVQTLDGLFEIGKYLLISSRIPYLESCDMIIAFCIFTLP